MKLICSIILSLAAILMFSACSSVQHVDTLPVRHLPSAVNSSYPGLKIIVSSQQLIDSVDVVSPKLGQDGEFTKAQVTVKNLTQNRYELECQFQWEDVQGFSVGSPRPWKRFVLWPDAEIPFSELALRPNAKQAIFTVRIVDDTFIELNRQNVNPSGR